MRPLRGGAAAGGRQGEGAAYPTTSHMELERVRSDYASEPGPISKERNSRDARFYRGNTGENEEQDECLYTWRQGIRAAANSTIVIARRPINGPTFSRCKFIDGCPITVGDRRKRHVHSAHCV